MMHITSKPGCVEMVIVLIIIELPTLLDVTYLPVFNKIFTISPISFQEIEQEKKDAEEAKKKAKQNSLLGFLQGVNANEEEGSIEFSFAGLFKCLLCTHPKGNEEKVQLMHIATTLNKLEKKIDNMER